LDDGRHRANAAYPGALRCSLWQLATPAAASGPRAPAAADIYPTTGRGRLSYPRAEYLIKQATAAHDYTRSAGPSTSCDTLPSSTWPSRAAPPPELQAKSRHAHLASLGCYVQLGEQTSAQVTANARPRRQPQTPLIYTRIGTVDGGNSARVGPLTPLAVRLLLKPCLRAGDQPPATRQFVVRETLYVRPAYIDGFV
jgi:hypothetical protein